MRRLWLVLIALVLAVPAPAGHSFSGPMYTTGNGDFYCLGGLDVDGTCQLDGAITYTAGMTGDDLVLSGTLTVGGAMALTDNITVAGLIIGRQPTAQYYKATATDTVQDLNVSTAVAIRWGTETFEDTGYTHGTTSLKSRCYLDTAGWYKVSYSVTHTNATGNRRNIMCYGKMNGSTVVTPSKAYGYTRNSVNPHGTATAVFLVQTTGANEYLQIFGMGEGEVVDSESANTTLDQCWVLIERIN